MDDSFVKWGLVGLGAYMLYESFFAPAVSDGAAAVANSAAAAARTTGAPIVAAQTQSTRQTTEQLNLETLQAIGPQPVVVAAQAGGDLASAGGSLTGPQWDWYLFQVSGINANDTATITGPLLSSFLPAGTTANTPLTASTWWAAIMQWAQAQAHASVQPVEMAASAGVSGADGAGLSGLGYRDANANFAAPPAPGAGRFDMVDEAWA